MSKIMQQELDKCKDCAEYGSEFCEDCLKEQKKELEQTLKDLTVKKEDAINTL